MKDKSVCPNCGKPIEVPSAATTMHCSHCNEELVVSNGGRVILAHPIRSYLLSDNVEGREARPSSPPAFATRPPLSPERKKRAVRLMHERLVHQEQLYHSGLIYGILAVVFGGLLGLLSWLRSEYVSGDWTSWLGLGFGTIVFAIGLFVTIWFLRALKSVRVSKREIEKEMV